MRVTLAAVGRAKAGPTRDLFDHYAGRLAWPIALREVEAGRSLPPQALKQKEGEKLLAAVPERARVVALDEGGRLLDSEDLARQIGTWRDGGNRDLAILIGGPLGLDSAVLARADLTLALGRMTWPHQLVRGLIAEQLYRAETILSGHPYHRE